MVTLSVRNSNTDGVSSISTVGNTDAGRDDAGRLAAGSDAAGSVAAGNEAAGNEPVGKAADSKESLSTPRILDGGGGGGGATGSTGCCGGASLSLLHAFNSIAVVTIPITRAALRFVKACMVLIPKN
jgi:hypothetical protein